MATVKYHSEFPFENNIVTTSIQFRQGVKIYTYVYTEINPIYAHKITFVMSTCSLPTTVNRNSIFLKSTSKRNSKLQEKGKQILG